MGQGGQGQGTSQRGSQSWGTGSGGNPLGGGMGGGAGNPDQGVNVDPGTDPAQNAQLGSNVDPGGMLPGGGRGAGQGGTQMDGIASGTGGPGSGELAGGGEDGPRVSGDSTVPASLRAYVRRYLDRIRGGERNQ